MTNHPYTGHGQCHVTHFQFWCPQSYLWYGWNESRQILYAGGIYQVLALDDSLPSNCHGQGHVIHYVNSSDFNDM